MSKHTIGDVEVELDDDVTPEDVERFGADSRTDTAVDVDAARAAAEDDADREDRTEDEEGDR